jgi:hypothetical protein
MELEWLKKKSDRSPEQLRLLARGRRIQGGKESAVEVPAKQLQFVRHRNPG